MMLSVVWLSLFLTLSKCYVTNNIKNIETTPNLPVDDEVLRKRLSESTENSERVQSNYIYLEDVLVGLQHQNWTDDELPCLNQTLELILSLQNFTLWAVWEWDAVASQPLGILSGNRHQLGNFDQCMRTPWSATHPEVKTQYCLAEVSLERTDRGINKRLEENKPYENALDFIQHQTPNVRPLSYLTWGACVPTSCAPRSVERLVGAVLARSHLGAAPLRPRISVSESCQRADRPKKLDAPLYGFIVLMGSLFLICLICTIKNARNNDSSNHSLKTEICKAFCLRENLKDLTKVKRDGIEIVYGIRYLTICFIAMCHLAGMMNSGPISNGIKVDNDALSVFGMFVLHDDVFVDTFFVISGFLVARALTSFDRFPNIFIFLIKRYIRLVVALAVVIFYLAAVFPYTGSGPLWNRFVENETDICRRSWWLNLLMISNYVNTDDACLVISWYIPCDFHFFVVTVVTYAVYRHWRLLGTCCVVVLGVASVVTPGVINYVNKLQAVQLFTYEFVSDPRKNDQFQMTYIKSHTRAAAYIVGFIAGFFFSKMKNKVALSKSRATCGACAGLAIMLLVMVSGTSYLWRNYSDIEGAFYAALNRPVWAVGVSMLILSCSFGEVPLLKGFLSWSPWVPLSRLAYGLYLTHTVIIVRNVGIARNSVYYDSFSVFMSSIGVIFVGTLCALIIWLLAEAPVNNLFLLCTKPKRPKIQKSGMDSVTTVEARGKPNVNNGYLHESLPENIHFSSKM